jgi:hypothetical protein
VAANIEKRGEEEEEKERVEEKEKTN